MKKNTFKVKVITLFPESFPGVLGVGVIGRALKKKIWSLKLFNPRDYAKDNHKSVDDTTSGGGPGMILRADIIGKAIDASLRGVKEKKKISLINLTPRGKPITQKDIKRFTKKNELIILCGRYEGIDQRVLDFYKFDEYSLGDYILAGGEVAAQTVIEAAVRLLPGTLGDKESLKDESFSQDLLEFPQYTRPRIWKNLKIPEELQSGNHKLISEWRMNNSLKLTQKIRPDLLKKYKKNKTTKK